MTGERQVNLIRIKDGKLGEVCADLGISRDELSRRLGVSTSTAFRIDSGRVDPSPKFIGALISLTGRPFEELFEVGEAVTA